MENLDRMVEMDWLVYQGHKETVDFKACLDLVGLKEHL